MDPLDIVQIIIWVLFAFWPFFSRLIRRANQKSEAPETQSPGAEEVSPETATPETAPSPSRAQPKSWRKKRDAASAPPPAPRPSPPRRAEQPVPSRAARSTDRFDGPELAARITERAERLEARYRELMNQSKRAFGRELPVQALLRDWFVQSPTALRDQTQSALLAGGQARTMLAEAAAHVDREFAEFTQLERVILNRRGTSGEVLAAFEAAVADIWEEYAEFARRRDLGLKEQRLLVVDDSPTEAFARAAARRGIAVVAVPPAYLRSPSTWWLAAQSVMARLMAASPGLLDEVDAQVPEGIYHEAPIKRGAFEEADGGRMVAAWTRTIWLDVWMSVVAGPAYLLSLLHNPLREAADQRHTVIPVDWRTMQLGQVAPLHVRIQTCIIALSRMGMGADTNRLEDAWRAHLEDGGVDADRLLLPLDDDRAAGFPMTNVMSELRLRVMEFLTHSFDSLDGFSVPAVPDLSLGNAASSRARSLARKLSEGTAIKDRRRVVLAGSAWAIERRPDAVALVRSAVVESILTRSDQAPAAGADSSSTHSLPGGVRGELRRAVAFRELIRPAVTRRRRRPPGPPRSL